MKRSGTRRPHPEPIAVIGMAGRFPGAPDLAAYWGNLRGGVESITRLTDEDLVAEGVPHKLRTAPDYVRAAPLLEGIDAFDAEFFNIGAREAALLDPQQRLFLEICWHALENAGHGPGTVRDVGVFAGANLPSYLISNLLGGARITMSPEIFELQIHNDKDYLASRTAFLLGLGGPALTIQTACSSSLVAVHQAVRALRSGECSMALAGGVAVRVPHRVGYRYTPGMICSPDGHCRPFDSEAAGTVFGSGVGAVVLRPLPDALDAGDTVLAVVRGSAVNNDGADKVGYTAPSAAGQERLITAALADAGVNARTITAIEAHGTATPIGDAIEIAALSRAFAIDTTDRGFCAVGSVKSNIGHLESAAGIAGFIKAVLQLHHGELVPSLHYRSPNPRTAIAETPFRVADAATPWPDGDAPHRIGVSSFGIGGTNAHAVLEAAPAPASSPAPARTPQIVVVSARSPRALDVAAEQLARHLAEGPRTAERFADAAATGRAGRAAHRFRRAVVARGPADAAALLTGGDSARVASAVAPPGAVRTVFLFPGQGAQYPGMGQGLYRDEPVYRAVVDECAKLAAPLLGLDLRDVLGAAHDADPEAAAHALRATAAAQPALFTVELALARQLAHWGIRPDAMVGHSLGEFTAACLAGVLDLPDALRLVCRRGRLMGELPPGAMLSVALDADELASLLPPELSVAAVNAPGMCVISGPTESVRRLEKRLTERAVATRWLHTSHAFHSAMIDPAVEPFTAEVRTVALESPHLPIVSTATGDWLDDSLARDPEYWGRHMRVPVRFGAAVRRAAESFDAVVLVEVGPGNALATLARQSLPPGTPVAGTMRRQDEERPDTEALLAGATRLWLAGAEVKWEALEPGRRRAPLPEYPFQRRRYWVEPHGADPGALTLDIPTPAPEEDGAGQPAGRPAHLLTPYAAPATEAERRMATLWEELFGFGPIGTRDNFFEIGGHSLLATQLVARLTAEDGTEVALGQLLARPTVAAMAELLGAGSGTGAPAAGRVPPLTPDPDRRHDPFPLVEMQQAQWLGRMGAFDMGGVAPHLYLEFDTTELDPQRLERGWRKVVRRHEMLRAVVMPDGRQRILPDVPDYRFGHLDLRGADPQEAERRLAEVSDRMAVEVRPADAWPLWEIRTTRLPGGVLRIHISFDLLVADVSSFFYQILPAWRGFTVDPDLPDNPPQLSFRDYALAEERLRQSPLYERSLAYWRERVRELPPAPELPAAAPDPGRHPEFVRRHARLEPGLWARIKAHAGEHGVTPSSVLLAAYAATVGRWSRHQHFTLNFTAVNRMPFHPQVDELVGEFASFELLEVDLRASASFAELVAQVQRRSWEDFEHRHVSGVRILRELNRVRGQTSGGVMPVVFTSALSTERDPREVPSPVGWLGEQKRFISQTPQVSIDHFVLEFAGALELAWHAVDALFPDGMMADMFASYRELLTSLADEESWERSPDAPLPAWQLEVRERANATAGPLPSGRLCDRVLAAGADAATADRSAVITAERTLTHAELARRAMGLAALLGDRGLGRGSVVAVGLGKGWRQIVAAVGASAAGCTVVPVAPALPAARRAWLVEHAGIECVLTERGEEPVAAGWPRGIPLLAVPEREQDAPGAAEWTCPAAEDDIAYVIYTSGSTGEPKGVAVSHRAALNTLEDIRERFGITADDRVLGLSSLSFDLSVFDVFGALSCGAAVVLPEPGARRDPARWARLMREHRVTVWNSVPALFDMLVTHLENESGTDPDEGTAPLRLALLSGDWIPVALPGRARARIPDLDVFSLGGATEAAIWSISYPIGEQDPGWTSVPYGFPLRNQAFHVLNDRMAPAPVWTPGELCIGGTGLAAGYWNDVERTAQSFITHPRTGERLYRTGDIGRYRPDGCLEFLGREDFQVKIGGFRVELGEVEHALGNCPGVEAAAAAALGPRTQRRLVGYVVPGGGERGPDEDAALICSVREHIEAVLPAYLVPADLVVLDTLPLTGNGKVDRAALPTPDRTSADQTSGAGADARLARVLDRLLALAGEALGTDASAADNFFSLGGDSIMGIRFTGLAVAQGLRVEPPDLFAAASFLELAERVLAALEERAAGAAQAVPLTTHQRLLAAERRTVLIERPLPAGLEASLAERALREMTGRQPALRLAFTLDEGCPAGQFDGGDRHRPAVSDVELTGLPAAAVPQAVQEIAEEIAEEADPVAGVPVKLAVIRTPEGDRAVWAGSAAVLDDESWRILLAEFDHACRALAEGRPARWTDHPGQFASWAAEQPRGGDGAVADPVPVAGRLVTRVDAQTVGALREAAFAAHHLTLAEAVAAVLLLAADGAAVIAERSLRPDDDRTTLGRYTDLVALVSGGPAADPVAAVRRAKSGFRGAPQNADATARIRLRHLSDAPWPDAGEEYPGPLAGALPAGTDIEVGAALTSAGLALCWEYTGAREDAAALADRFAKALPRLVDACQGATAGAYEPADFPLAGMDRDGLDAFLATLAPTQTPTRTGGEGTS